MKVKRKSMGINKKSRSKKKPRSLMKRVDNKIQKAIGKTVEWKLKPVANATLYITPIPAVANLELPVANYKKISVLWPVVGTTLGATSVNRIGNVMKKCTTYFTIQIRAFSSKTAAASDQIPSLTYRVIIFTSAEEINTANPIANFFQFFKDTAGTTTMINPTNKLKITVLHDKVYETPFNYNLGTTTPSGGIGIRQNKIIRYSRKFKEVLFDGSQDDTPKRPYRNTYLAVFSDNISTGTVGDVHIITRYYWLD